MPDWRKNHGVEHDEKIPPDQPTPLPAEVDTATNGKLLGFSTDYLLALRKLGFGSRAMEVLNTLMSTTPGVVDSLDTVGCTKPRLILEIMRVAFSHDGRLATIEQLMTDAISRQILMDNDEVQLLALQQLMHEQANRQAFQKEISMEITGANKSAMLRLLAEVTGMVKKTGSGEEGKSNGKRTLAYATEPLTSIPDVPAADEPEPETLGFEDTDDDEGESSSEDSPENTES